MGSGAGDGIRTRDILLGKTVRWFRKDGPADGLAGDAGDDRETIGGVRIESWFW